MDLLSSHYKEVDLFIIAYEITKNQFSNLMLMINWLTRFLSKFFLHEVELQRPQQSVIVEIAHYTQNLCKFLCFQEHVYYILNKGWDEQTENKRGPRWNCRFCNYQSSSKEHSAAQYSKGHLDHQTRCLQVIIYIHVHICLYKYINMSWDERFIYMYIYGIGKGLASLEVCCSLHR